MAERICPFCGCTFTPHAKVGNRQVCCRKDPCKEARKRRANQRWRANNPDYDKGRYLISTKPWLEKHHNYLRQWRIEKREQENNLSKWPVELKDKDDIQDKLNLVKTTCIQKMADDIQDKLNNINTIIYVVFKQLHDIQDKLNTPQALLVKGWT